MLRAILISVLLLPAAPALALKHWPRECRADIARNCKAVIEHDDREILSCLRDHVAKLSKSCRKLLDSYGHLPK